MINEFRNEYRFLSNFYESPLTYDGITYQTAEAAFQASKIDPKLQFDPKTNLTRRDISKLTPVEAKQIGKRVKLRPDWEDVKLQIMTEIVHAKFEQNPILAEKLILTGDKKLIEGNTWRDTYWGYDVNMKKGFNHLGQILMDVRAELQSSQSNDVYYLLHNGLYRKDFYPLVFESHDEDDPYWHETNNLADATFFMSKHVAEEARKQALNEEQGTNWYDRDVVIVTLRGNCSLDDDGQLEVTDFIETKYKGYYNLNL